MTRKYLKNDFIDPSEIEGFFQASDQIEDAIKYLVGKCNAAWIKTTREENGFSLFVSPKRLEFKVSCDCYPGETRQMYIPFASFTPEQFALELLSILTLSEPSHGTFRADALAFLGETVKLIQTKTTEYPPKSYDK